MTSLNRKKKRNGFNLKTLSKNRYCLQYNRKDSRSLIFISAEAVHILTEFQNRAVYIDH